MVEARREIVTTSYNGFVRRFDVVWIKIPGTAVWIILSSEEVR